jgi:uncharacterized protein (TIGR03435 family)
MSGNRYTSSDLPLISVTRLAYNVRVCQVIGAPAWLLQKPYDIAANAEGDRALTDCRTDAHTHRYGRTLATRLLEQGLALVPEALRQMVQWPDRTTSTG